MKALVTEERGDHEPDEEHDQQRTEAGHEEFPRGIVFTASPPSLALGVTFSRRAFRGFPLFHVPILTQVTQGFDFRWETLIWGVGNDLCGSIFGGVMSYRRVRRIRETSEMAQESFCIQ